MTSSIGKVGNRNANRQHFSGSSYVPATPERVRSVTFTWVLAGSAYILRGAVATHKGGGVLPLRPVIGGLAMMPSTGRYFYEFRVNTDSCLVGVCTSTAYPNDGDLDTYELGTCAAGASPVTATAESGNPSYPHTIGAVRAADRPLVAVFNAQTSKSTINGVMHKHLWRQFIAISGANFSFVVDTDEGVVQLFVDKRYAGIVFEGLRGCTLYPCVGIGGTDMNNRVIGTGIQSATVSPSHPFDCLY